MRVKEIMMGTPYYCHPETNLGSATEMMWNANCGFLPVETNEGKVIGVVTDRDICIGLGTRNRPSGDVTVEEIMSGKLYCCEPDDEVHAALKILSEGRVRRLPVLAPNGTLVGVLSMDDILSRTEPISFGKSPELSSEEVVRTFRMITQRPVPEVLATRTATA
jgi:CBS domain-containing protein